MIRRNTVTFKIQYTPLTSPFRQKKKNEKQGDVATFREVLLRIAL